MTSFVSTIVYQISLILALVLYALWAILLIALYVRFRFKFLLLLIISHIIGISYCLLRFLPYIGIPYRQTEYLIDLLQDKQRTRWKTSSIRPLLRRHMDFYGSTKEMAEWLKKNKGGIVFDNDTKKFKVGGLPLKGE